MKFEPRELKETADISSGESNWPTFLKDCASVALTLIGLYLILGFTADFVAKNISEKHEAKVFGALRSLIPSKPSPEQDRVDNALKKLTSQPHLRPLPYFVFVIQKGDPNAFALPGGAIGISSSLLKNVKGETGLAMVLAHEIGHHQHRHALRGLGRGILISLFSSMLFSQDPSKMMDLLTRAALMNHSRRQEEAADAFGLDLVFKAYGYTTGAEEFFEFVRKKDLEENSTWKTFLSTHPFIENRIAFIKNNEKKGKA